MRPTTLLLSVVTVLSSLQHVSGLQTGLEAGCDPGCQLTKILAEDDTGPEPVLDADLEAYANTVEQLIQKLPFSQGMTRFDDEWKISTKRLIPALVNLTTIDNTQFNFLKLVRLLMDKTKEEDKKSLLIECAISAFETRPDASDYEVDIEQVYPALTGTSNLDEDAAMGTDYTDESWNKLSARHKRPRVIADESKLDYFREDNQLHVFHDKWHIFNNPPSSRTPNDRQYERFFAMHRYLLNRYMVERKIAGLRMPTPLDRSNRKKEFSSRYSIRQENDPKNTLGSRYASNKDKCQLRKTSRAKLNKLEDDCEASMNSRNMAKFFDKCNNYHNIGHRVIGGNCAGKKAIMRDSETAARDPVFYRWHSEIDLKYGKFLAKQGKHSIKAVRPPKGITVARVSLDSRCPTNNVETYWEQYKQKRTKYFRLQHQPYSVNIRLNNPKRFSGKVIVRLFLFHEDFAESLKYPIELDRFVQDLSGQTTEEFSRKDTQSMFTMKSKDKCGWPTHLLLPKGKTLGSTKFRLAVFVNNLKDSQTNLGLSSLSSKQGSPIICGAKPGSGVVPDTRREGFPFDLGWRFNKAKVINNKDKKFGNITARIRIHHVGKINPRNNGCMANL